MADDSYNLRNMSDQELYRWISGWKENTDKHIAGQQEIRRRNKAPAEKRAWLAIGISIVALVISGIALLK